MLALLVLTVKIFCNAGPAGAQAAASDDAVALESAVFEGINDVRRDPTSYARWIERTGLVYW